jgi:hypothetical protein
MLNKIWIVPKENPLSTHPYGSGYLHTWMAKTSELVQATSSKSINYRNQSIIWSRKLQNYYDSSNTWEVLM